MNNFNSVNLLGTVDEANYWLEKLGFTTLNEEDSKLLFTPVTINKIEESNGENNW